MRAPRTIRRLALVLSLGALSVLLGAPSALAKAGDVDPSFGTGGTVVTPLASGEEQAHSVALQADGKIVAAGYASIGGNHDFALARYTTAGVLDPAFGSAGKVTTPIGSGQDEARAVAVQPDGRIVVVGFSSNGSNTDFALARYTTAGALDASFGTGGKVTTPIGSDVDQAYAMAIQSDGKILVAGDSYNGSNYDFAVARYTTSGALDSTFGTGGKVTTAIGPAGDEAYGVAVQTDGKIVVAGDSSNGTKTNFALARYTSSGALDSTFGTGGKVTTSIGPTYDVGRAVALQSDGKIVVAGHSTTAPRQYFALARYTTTGALDTSFGTGGTVTTAIGSSTDNALAIAIQPNGKIVAAGHSYNASNADFAVARYTTAGALDASFGAGGTVATAIGSSNDFATAVAVQPNGAIVAAGFSRDASNVYHFALARYQGDPIVVTIAQAGSSFFFSPTTVVPPPGVSVQWVNTSLNPPTTHTTTGDAPLSLWNSTVGPGASFTQAFTVAGVYTYHCAIHGFTGAIQVLPKASPSSGSTATNFTITWAGGTIPPGYAADVIIKRPGANWVAWKTNRTGTQVSAQFTPDAGSGTYTFAARIRNSSTGGASGWSGVAISVS